MHLIKVEINQESLICFYTNLLGDKKTRVIDLTRTYLAFLHEDNTSYEDAKLEIRLYKNTGKILLSTNKSKYWSYLKDKETILKLFEELKSQMS